MPKPKRMLIGGEWYAATVLQVVEEDELGRPLVLRVLRDNESVKVEGGEKFLIAMCHEEAIGGTGGSRKGDS